jgi:hypothetical protein
MTLSVLIRFGEWEEEAEVPLGGTTKDGYIQICIYSFPDWIIACFIDRLDILFTQ